MYVYSPDRWTVVADHSRTDVPPGKIKSYPCTQLNFTGRTVGSFTALTAEFDMRCPPVGEWDTAFDIWLGKWGAIAGELMVWTDYGRYNGPLPPKNAVDVDRPVIDGQGYVAWQRPLNPGDKRPYIALAMTPMKAVGSVDLLAVFQWLVSKGWLRT